MVDNTVESDNKIFEKRYTEQSVICRLACKAMVVWCTKAAIIKKIDKTGLIERTTVCVKFRMHEFYSVMRVALSNFSPRRGLVILIPVQFHLVVMATRFIQYPVDLCTRLFLKPRYPIYFTRFQKRLLSFTFTKKNIKIQ